MQDNVALTASTGGGDAEGPSPGPIMLQKLIGPVRFRNIWVDAATANPPLIACSRSGTNVVISWPAAPNGFILESSTTLSSSAAWYPVASLPITADDRNVITQQLSPGPSFFRLRQPH